MDTPNCIDIGIKIIDGMWLCIMILLIAWVITRFSLNIIRLSKQKKTRIAFYEKLIFLYTNIYKSDFDIEKFIQENDDLIDKFALIPQEIAILKDKFACLWEYGEKYIPDNCIICLHEFNSEEIMIDYPFCNHSYHFDCLMVW